MEKNGITCPHCGKDITESVNKAMAARAGKARHAGRDKGYFRELAKKRWTKKDPPGEKEKGKEK